MKRLTLISLVLGIVLAVAPAAYAVVLSEGSGSGGSVAAAPGGIDPATQAVIDRSAALASHYTDPATLAVIERSKGLADYYSTNGVTFHTDVLGGNGGESTSPVSSSTGDSIGWNAGIAGAALIAAMFLALGFAVTNRRRHQLSF
jgi:ABC-type dipeptide/oligopeptide/nickel transport system permease component